MKEFNEEEFKIYLNEYDDNAKYKMWFILNQIRLSNITEDKGWECEDSPTGYCEYDYEQEDSWDAECCIHCHQPEERK